MQLSQQEIVVKFAEILPIFDSFANICNLTATKKVSTKGAGFLQWLLFFRNLQKRFLMCTKQ
jgi:hypothetical protein